MSRHEIKPLSDRYRVVVGWDRPLNTFFAQIKDLTVDEDDDEKDPIVLWVGIKPSEITSPEALMAAIQNYAIISSETMNQLHTDRDATKGIKDTPLQEMMKKIIEG